MTYPPATKTCPFCAEQIQLAALVCKHCGRELPTAPHLVKRDAVTTCSACNGAVRPDAVKCKHCGVAFSGPVTTAPPLPRAPTPALVNIIAVVVILVVLYGAWVIVRGFL